MDKDEGLIEAHTNLAVGLQKTMPLIGQLGVEILKHINNDESNMNDVHCEDSLACAATELAKKIMCDEHDERLIQILDLLIDELPILRKNSISQQEGDES